MTLEIPTMVNNFRQSQVIGDGLGGDVKQKIITEAEVGTIPIGSILPWAKSISGVPALGSEYVQCDGQVLSDPDSPLNGQTMPSLNAASKFLKGSTTSGGTGGSDTSTTTTVTDDNTNQVVVTNSTENRPSFYNVVWIIKVK